MDDLGPRGPAESLAEALRIVGAEGEDVADVESDIRDIVADFLEETGDDAFSLRPREARERVERVANAAAELAKAIRSLDSWGRSRLELNATDPAVAALLSDDGMALGRLADEARAAAIEPEFKDPGGSASLPSRIYGAPLRHLVANVGLRLIPIADVSGTQDGKFHRACMAILEYATGQGVDDADSTYPHVKATAPLIRKLTYLYRARAEHCDDPSAVRHHGEQTNIEIRETELALYGGKFSAA